MTGGFGIDKTGLPWAIGASLVSFSLLSRFFLNSFSRAE